MGRPPGRRSVLAKLESHLEAWNGVFCFAEEALLMPPGSIKATVLIETIPAAFEMHAILYELQGDGGGTEGGGPRFMTRDVYGQIRAEELLRLGGPDRGRLREAAALLDHLVTAAQFAEFLTVPAYADLS